TTVRLQPFNCFIGGNESTKQTIKESAEAAGALEIWIADSCQSSADRIRITAGRMKALCECADCTLTVMLFNTITCLQGKQSVHIMWGVRIYLENWFFTSKDRTTIRRQERRKEDVCQAGLEDELKSPKKRLRIDSQVHSVLCHVFSAVPLCALSDLEAFTHYEVYFGYSASFGGLRGKIVVR
ncbi:hypothetical protein KUCAC02_007022, partial [Chaenocephalus aceratus]